MGVDRKCIPCLTGGCRYCDGRTKHWPQSWPCECAEQGHSAGRTCHNEYDEAIREVARIHNTTPMTVRRIVEDYFRELDRVTGRKGISESETP